MQRTLAAITLLVPDYDEAIAFFTQAMRWKLLEDTRLSDSKRWVRVAAEGGSALLLAQPSTPEQAAQVGRHAGGRVGLFLHTDNLDTEMAHLRAHAVRFSDGPRDEPYGRVVIFTDPWGNRWDLIEPKAA
jgi:predicted enzyme related to lactoylglutathione lyase